MFPAKAQRVAQDLASNTMARALGLSLLLHIATIGGIELGNKLGLWSHSFLPASNLAEEVRKAAEQRKAQAPAKEQEPPLLFVEVDPTQAAPEPPKEAKYYSTANTIAANPDPKLDLDVPKIEGRQDKIPKTYDVMKPAAQPLQPAPPPAPKEAAKTEPAPEAPKPAEKEGETLMARATPRAEKAQPDNPSPSAEKPRARTLQEARSNKGLIEGERMRQEGGVRRAMLDPGLNVKASPFGNYDAEFIQAVQSRWFNLLDERDFVRSQSGRVVLIFRLNKDGRITEMQVAEADVTDTLAWLCQRAVLDPAPYKPFPSDMRRILPADYREVRFTFYYNY